LPPALRSTRILLQGIEPGFFRLTGAFDADDPQSLAVLLAREPGLSVERRDGEILDSRQTALIGDRLRRVASLLQSQTSRQGVAQEAERDAGRADRLLAPVIRYMPVLLDSGSSASDTPPTGTAGST